MNTFLIKFVYISTRWIISNKLKRISQEIGYHCLKERAYTIAYTIAYVIAYTIAYMIAYTIAYI